MEVSKKKKHITFCLEERQEMPGPMTPDRRLYPMASSTPMSVSSSSSLSSSSSYFPEYLLKTQYQPEKENIPCSSPPTIGLFDQLQQERLKMKLIKNRMQKMETQENFNASEQNPQCSVFSDYFQVERPLNTELWVTVFGFKPIELNDVINFFTVYCGRIVDKKYPPQKYNWVEIQFEFPYQVIKALRYNGKIINGSTMIGVVKSPYENEELKYWVYRGAYDTMKPLSVNNSRMFNWSLNQNGSNGSIMTRFFQFIFGLQ